MPFKPEKIVRGCGTFLIAKFARAFYNKVSFNPAQFPNRIRSRFSNGEIL